MGKVLYVYTKGWSKQEIMGAGYKLMQIYRNKQVKLHIYKKIVKSLFVRL